MFYNMTIAVVSCFTRPTSLYIVKRSMIRSLLPNDAVWHHLINWTKKYFFQKNLQKVDSMHYFDKKNTKLFWVAGFKILERKG